MYRNTIHANDINNTRLNKRNGNNYCDITNMPKLGSELIRNIFNLRSVFEKNITNSWFLLQF